MTTPPRYPTDQPEYGPDASPYGGQPYPTDPTHVPSNLRYHWRYTYNPYQSAAAALKEAARTLPRTQD